VEDIIPVGRDRIWVEDSQGPGPAVLLLHPGIADSRCWDPIWPALSAARRAVRFDVRAFGRSPAATEPYSIVGDALAVLDHLGIESAHLVGCSVGGAASLDLAVHHPHRVRSLLLLCPAVNGYDWPDEPLLEQEYDALVAADDQEGLFQFGVRRWLAAGLDPLVEPLVRDAGKAQANEEEHATNVDPTYDRLGEITVPTVLMVGDVDNPTLVAADLAAADRIPGCRLVMMPGVDHLPMMREPDQVLAEVLALSHE
jgi:pimeloyl-ACP methyl ester carboxylesterase